MTRSLPPSTTEAGVQGDDHDDETAEPADASHTDSPSSDAPADDAASAARLAERAARRARRAQRQAERARRLADEYARLAAQAETAPDAESAPDAETTPDPETTPGAETAPDTESEPVEVTDDVLAPTDHEPGAEEAQEPVEADASPSSRVPLLAAVGALVVALAFAVVATVVHVTGGGAASNAAQVRDQVLLSARQDIVVLNTLSWKDVDAGLAAWSDASTGSLHKQLLDVTSATRKQIEAAHTVTTATVLDAAVSSLDAASGQATVIASVELTVTPEGKQAQVRRERLQAQLVRVGSSWKVGQLAQVGVTVQ